MLKKVVIAGLAVVVGVAVLAWLSPALFDWMVHQGKSLKDSAEEAVPLEQRIEILKDKLKDLQNNREKYFHQAATVGVEVDNLTKKVADDTAKVDLQWKKVEALRSDLDDTQRTSFRYNRGLQAQRGREAAEAGLRFLQDRGRGTGRREGPPERQEVGAGGGPRAAGQHGQPQQRDGSPSRADEGRPAASASA